MRSRLLLLDLAIDALERLLMALLDSGDDLLDFLRSDAQGSPPFARIRIRRFGQVIRRFEHIDRNRFGLPTSHRASEGSVVVPFHARPQSVPDKRSENVETRPISSIA